MKKNGFTLVELLAVIVILSILFSIGFYSYTAYVSSAREKTKKIEIAQIINSGAAYHKEMQQNKNYLYYVDKNNVKYSCISIKSLIDMGYYKGNVSFLNEELTKENAVVKIKEVNGVASYEVVAPYVKDQDCVYYYVSNEISDNTNIVLKDGDDDNTISFDTRISKITNSKNSYLLNMSLSADFYSRMVNFAVPVYVLIVMDVSGSMGKNNSPKYKNAKAAAIALSENIVNSFDDSYVGLINFSTKASLKRDFEHKNLVSDDFNKAKGWTNVLNAFNLAYNKISKIPNNGIETIKYVIFLSDGEPAEDKDKPVGVDLGNKKKDTRCKEMTSDCITALGEYSDKIKSVENTTFLIIGYEMSTVNIYKAISSIDTKGTSCPATKSDNYINGQKHCYYNSDNSGINTLFSNISNVISKNVKNINVSKSKVYAEFTNVVKLFDNYGNRINNLNFDIDFTKNVDETLKKNYQYIISVDNIDESKFTCDYDKKECTYKVPIFNKYYVNLYDTSSNLFKRLEPSSYPTLVITRSLKSYIN